MFSNKNISFLVISEEHFDPTSKLAVLSAIKKLNASHVPIVYCCEHGPDESIQQRIKTLNLYIETAKKLISTMEFESLFYQSSGEIIPFLSSSQRKEMQDKWSKMFRSSLSECTDLFDMFHAYLAERLLLTYLQENKISRIPIDKDEKDSGYAVMRSKLVEDIKKDSSDPVDRVFLCESRTIDAMVKQINDKAIPELNSGGIIICHVGHFHADRLAAYLYKKFQSTTEVVFCYSDGLVSSLKEIEDWVRNAKSRHDSSEVNNIYTKIKSSKEHFDFLSYDHLVENLIFNQKIDSLVSLYLKANSDGQTKPVHQPRLFMSKSRHSVQHFSSKTPLSREERNKLGKV